MSLYLISALLLVTILMLALPSLASARFWKIVSAERHVLLSKAQRPKEKVLSENRVNELPEPVRKWLHASGVVGREIPESIYLEQEAQMKLKPDQKRWFKAKADQVFTLDPPAFNWSVSVDMGHGIKALGRDEFTDGKGEMKILLLGLIPVAKAGDNEKTNQSTLQRFLAEMVWFPSATTCPYVQWREIDPRTAEATMTWGGIQGSGLFFFDENGDFLTFKAMRFKDHKDEEPSQWIVSCARSEVLNGIRIPVECEVKWKTEAEDWTWLQLKVTNLVYVNDIS